MSSHPDISPDTPATPGRDHVVIDPALPAIDLVPRSEPAPDCPGTSRFGGAPDVVAEFRWPRHRGRPLSFLLQVDLSDLDACRAATELPRGGLLSFFYDATGQPWGFRAADRGGWRAVYVADIGALRRFVGRPRGLSPEVVFPERSLTPTDVDSLPRDLGLCDDEIDLDPRLDEAYRREVTGPDLPVHRMLGHPHPIQEPLHEVTEDGPDAWRSLLQLDSDPALDTMWSDSGKLHWYITRRDLQAARFDAIDFTLQCC